MFNSRIPNAIFVSLGIGVFVLIYCYVNLNSTVSAQAGYFQIKPGAGVNAIIDQLDKEQRINTQANLLKLYAYFTRAQGEIKVGEYELDNELSAINVLDQFRRGKVVQREIVFPEGLTIAEWKQILASNTFIQHTIDGQSDLEMMKRLGSSSSYAEGQFFPDTYRFNRGSTDISILRKAYESMQLVLREEWQGRDSGINLEDPQAALIFASMVEKETGYAPDRNMIASVFANRLRIGMKMQSDPTVIYGELNYGTQGFDGDLKRSHLRAKTPFNTYVIKALPPTPICNPGLAAIRASLHPPLSEYLYFVARGDGSSQFSETLAEHNSAVRKYQLSGKAKAAQK